MAGIGATWDAITRGRDRLYGYTWQGSDGVQALARVSAESIETVEVHDPDLHDCRSVIDRTEQALNSGVDGDPVKALATVGPRVASDLRPINGVRYLAACFDAAEKAAPTPASRALAAAGRGLGNEWFLISSSQPEGYGGLLEMLKTLATTLAALPGGPVEQVCAAAALQMGKAPGPVQAERIVLQAIKEHATDPAIAQEAGRLADFDANPADQKKFFAAHAPRFATLALGMGLPQEAGPITVDGDVLQIGSITLPRRAETRR